MNNMSELDKKRLLIEEIKYELIYYFREGFVNPKFFFEFDDMYFSSFQDVLKIHFMLSNEVKTFIETLYSYFGDFRNSTHSRPIECINEVKGRINWDKTIKARNQRGNIYKNIYVCDNVDKQFNTKENIVLKKSIEIIYNIVFKQIGMERFHSYEWYSHGARVSKIINQLYTKNVYIKKIDISNITIDKKIIRDVSKSRYKLYQDASKVLSLYYTITHRDKDNISEIINSTYIEMKNIDEVFELYCIIKYIKSVTDESQVKFNIIDGNEEYLAKIKLENDVEKLIFHNRTASNYLEFKVKYDEILENHEYLNKIRNVKDRVNEFKKNENMVLSDLVWSGRPDLIILTFRKNNLQKIEVGEIKYTRSMSYLIRGFEELSEYLEFINIIDFPNKKIKVKGLLFVEDVAIKNAIINDTRIINAKNINELY